MLGGPGPDTLTSKGWNDFLAGQAGTDVLTLAGGHDTVVGLDADGDQVHNREAGYIVLLFGPEPVEVDLAAGTANRVGAATGDALTGLSPPKNPPYIVVYGTDGDDRISGNDGGTGQLYGRSGNDILSDPGDGYILIGGPGDDACINAEGVTGC
jgi:Ca2+-binding RTX toxin-like protein